MNGYGIDFSPLEKLWGVQPKGENKLDNAGSKYKKVYRAVHDFHHRHIGSTDWEAIAADMSEVSKSLESDQFANDMLLSVYSELEREAGIS